LIDVHAHMTYWSDPKAGTPRLSNIQSSVPLSWFSWHRRTLENAGSRRHHRA
jgi:hypothetical protein